MDKKKENKRRRIDAKAEREELVANYVSPRAHDIFHEMQIEHIFRSRLRLEGVFSDEILEDLISQYKDRVRDFNTVFRELILQDKWLGRDMYAERIVLEKDGNFITRYFTPRLTTPTHYWAMPAARPWYGGFEPQDLDELKTYFMDVDIKMRHLLLDGWQLHEADPWPKLPFKAQVTYVADGETKTAEMTIHMFWITSLVLALAALMEEVDLFDDYPQDSDAIVMDINNLLREKLGKNVEVKSYSFPEIDEWAAQTAWQLDKKGIHLPYDWENKVFDV